MQVHLAARAAVRCAARWMAVLATLAPSFAALAADAPLALVEASRIAAQRSPQLASQRALVSAAEAAAVGAGELPDPKAVIGIENLPTSGPDRWNANRDSMTQRTIGVMQDVPGAGKRALRTQRAEAESTREALALTVQQLAVQRDAALAWLSRWYAEASLRLAERMLDEARTAVESAAAAYRGGRGSQADLLAARAAAVEFENRRTDAAAQVRRASIALARYVGDNAERTLGPVPAMNALPHAVAHLTAEVDTHPELRLLAQQEAVATTDVELARIARHPDWNIGVSYGIRGSSYSNMVTLLVSVDLPLFPERRQDAQQLAKLRQLDSVRAQREEMRVQHVAEIEAMVAEWEASRIQAARVADELVPIAALRVDAALAAYRGGSGSLSAVLDARRGVIEAQLAQLQQEKAAARLWIQLQFVLPIEEKL
jgi:outer membrane protein TolC